MLDRQRRVLGGEHALDQDRHAAVRGQLLEVGPAQRRLHQRERLLDRHRPIRAERRFDARNAQLLGDLEPGPPVALAIAAARGVDRHHDRLVAAVDRLLDQRPGDALVLEAVELKPAPSPRRRFGDRPWPPRRQRREAHHRPRRGSGPSHRLLPVRIDQPLVGNRRDQHRHREVPAQQLHPGRPRIEPGKRPRPQPPARPGSNVLPQRQLIPGPTEEVPGNPGIQLLSRNPLEVGDVDQPLDHGEHYRRWPGAGAGRPSRLLGFPPEARAVVRERRWRGKQDAAAQEGPLLLPSAMRTASRQPQSPAQSWRTPHGAGEALDTGELVDTLPE